MSSSSGSGRRGRSLYADPARLREFLSSMTSLSHGANMTIAKAFPWSNYKTFVDVGTAQGDLAVQIAKAPPRRRGSRKQIADRTRARPDACRDFAMRPSQGPLLSQNLSRPVHAQALRRHLGLPFSKAPRMPLSS